MNNDAIEDSCDCPIECNSISFSFTLESTKFEQKEACPDIKNHIGENDYFKRFENFPMKPFYKYRSPPLFVRRLMKIKTNVSVTDEADCKKKLKYRAQVIFRLATNSMSVTILSSRLSFFDKMSSFGMKHKLIIHT